MNAIAAKAGNIVRWEHARRRMQAGDSRESIAATFKVKPNTIDKYLQQLETWKREDKSTDQNMVVESILPRVRDGENSYSIVKEMVVAFVTRERLDKDDSALGSPADSPSR